MKKRINYLRSSLYANVIGGLIMAMMVFGAVILIVGYTICVSGFKNEHSETTYRMADTAASLVEGDYIHLYMQGSNKLEYDRMKRGLDLCCNKMNVSLIYVIVVDTSDYGSFTNVVNLVNNSVDDTAYTPWELGYQRNTTNDEYREKYRAIYETGATHETVYRMNPEDGSKPHITTMVPIRDHTESVVAILCVQRPVSELFNTMRPYIFVIVGCVLALVTFSNLFIALFIKRAIINPVNKVSREATRFARENTKGEPLGKISRYTVFTDLSESIDDMETELTEYIDNLTAVTAEKERMGAELDIARRIQTGMIPNVFPPFPERKEFDIYGSMTPAKEVGGDFYHFFFVDSDHLALVIADVSGKGVPAALFMMATSILIRQKAQAGEPPAEVLAAVNDEVFHHNQAGMFVTVWLGVLEISTGRLVSANAGHEDPVVCRKDGEFAPLKSRHGLMLGAIEHVRYRSFEFSLNSGDKLFLFTDGVPEAKNAEGKRFRISGMLDALNAAKNRSPREIIEGVRGSIDRFVGDAPQFDDLTMLCVEINGKSVSRSLTTEASVGKLGEVKRFVSGVLSELDCPKKTQKKINLAVEEVFVNIARYAYGDQSGTAEVAAEGDSHGVTITFRDSGVPYDPLEKQSPDLSLTAEERPIGGLGVYLVRQNMDSVSYLYSDGQNVLTMEKGF